LKSFALRYFLHESTSANPFISPYSQDAMASPVSSNFLSTNREKEEESLYGQHKSTMSNAALNAASRLQVATRVFVFAGVCYRTQLQHLPIAGGFAFLPPIGHGKYWCFFFLLAVLC
jgi:hypothetical protein